MYDLVIRGGDVVDGTGTSRRSADVAVRDGRIVAIGDLEGAAAQVLDATGKVVTPGFIDVHTHYDAQAFWDGSLSPSPLHGVTTAIGGNCGFTIAPLSEKPDDGDYLMRMLARVEGMPLESLREGVPWNWTTTSEYLDALDGQLGINAGFMIGHSAIRRIAMGPACVQREASPDELAAMQALLRAGLEAGGFGLSSSWSRTHNDADGNMVPSRYAARSEIIELCRTVSEHPGTSLEFIPMVGPEFESWAVELMADMSVAAQRALNWNVMLVSSGNRDECERKLEAGDVARARGGRVVALTVPMNFPIRLSFRSGFVLDAIPGWEDVMLLPLDQKLDVFRDREQRARLNDLAQRDDNPMREVARWRALRIHDVVAPENMQYRGLLVGEISDLEGRDPWDVLTSIALADDLNTSFGRDAEVETDDDWKARIDVWRDRRALIGASDAGAHLDMFATFNYATTLLGKAVRECKLLPLEEAVHLMTQVPAELYGLTHRGRVEEGWHADLVVLDPDIIGSKDVEMRLDLPGGAPRLYAEAHGVEHVFVNGGAIVRDGKLTDERSGTLLRAGRDTATAPLG
jgi:N-acyl-D-aspartate/D-glutamate deacylase